MGILCARAQPSKCLSWDRKSPDLGQNLSEDPKFLPGIHPQTWSREPLGDWEALGVLWASQGQLW